MNFISTRNPEKIWTLSAAIHEGLAVDGGLFVPQQMPIIDTSLFSSQWSYPQFASRVLNPFFNTDVLATHCADFCEQALNFPIPLKKLDEHLFVLELFHGPTSSFKDVGARFLAECLNESAHGQNTIIVATSGDTGSAVASAFYRKSNYRVIILYPYQQVSLRQEQQMTCWGENIIALAVDGTFDDCQRLAKAAFSSANWQESGGLSSANSINIGRLLPQITYYAYSSMQFYNQHALKPGFIIPSGNLGNATAAYWAKAMGFPIREIVLATNANSVLVDYLNTGHYQSQASIQTIANAMDVGNPSNLERLNYLFDSFCHLKQQVKAISVNDDHIKKTIRQIYQDYKYISCPHTATAFYAHQQLELQPWIVVATADPCKFSDIIEPIINIEVPVSTALQKLLDRPNRIRRVNADLAAIQDALT